MAKHRKTDLTRTPSKPLPPEQDIAWFRERLAEWAAENGRDFPWRHTKDPYRVVVTEILLQQTTASAVEKTYAPFFDQYPTWESLHSADTLELEAAIAGLGLRSQRSKRLKALAAWVAEHEWTLPSTREELEEVPGVGQYVASAYLAVCLGKPEPLLDVNMARVLERFFGPRTLADIRDDPWLQRLARVLASNTQISWAILDLAAACCRAPKPSCERCKLRVSSPDQHPPSGCKFYALLEHSQ